VTFLHLRNEKTTRGFTESSIIIKHLNGFRGRFPQQGTKFHVRALLSTIGYYVFAEMKKKLFLPEKLSRGKTHGKTMTHDK
jgi:hypothetical protein